MNQWGIARDDVQIKSIHDLPDWFDIGNYNCLRNLDRDQIAEQVEFRYLLLSCADDLNPLSLSDLNDGYLPFETPDCYRWRSILRGNPLIDFSEEYRTDDDIRQDEENELFLEEIQSKVDKSNKDYLEENPELKTAAEALDDSLRYAKEGRNCIAHTTIVNGTQLRTLKTIYDKFETNGLIGNEFPIGDMSPTLFFSDINTASITHNIPIFDNSTVFLDISLTRATDKEILNQIEQLLPIWRESLNMPSPPKLGDTPSIIGKVIPYKIIPYLDLKIWIATTTQKLTYPNLVELLYPNDDTRSVDNFKQVVVEHEKK